MSLLYIFYYQYTLSLPLLVALTWPKQNDAKERNKKCWNMLKTLSHLYSSDSTRQERSNEY